MIFGNDQFLDSPFGKGLRVTCLGTVVHRFLALFVLQDEIQSLLNLLLIFADFFILYRLLNFLLFFHFDLVDLFELLGVPDVSEIPLPDDDSLMQNHYLVSVFCKIGCMGGEEDGLAFEVGQNGFLDEEFSHGNIDSTDDIVQQQNVSLGISCSRQRNPCLLPT